MANKKTTSKSNKETKQAEAKPVEAKPEVKEAVVEAAPAEKKPVAKKAPAKKAVEKVVEKGEKAEKVEKGEKAEKVEKEEKVDKAEKAEKKASPVKKGKKQSAEKPAKKSNKTAKSKKPEAAAKRAPKKAAEAKAELDENRTRYFKVMVGGGDAHGRFSGTKPKQAANKALTSILKTKEKDGDATNGKIKFSIIECTRGSKHKQYNYIGERVELDNPMQVTIGKGDGAKVIEYKFNNKVMKDKTTQ